MKLDDREENYSRLIARIREVFADVLYPGDDDIISTPDHLNDCGECSGLREALVGRKWEDLAIDESRSAYISHAMSFFGPRGWHYYLPAYLIHMVNRGVFASLYFRPSNITPQFLEQRIALLTRSQCRVVIAYLLIVLKEDQSSQRELGRNLEAVNYWKAQELRLSNGKSKEIEQGF